MLWDILIKNTNTMIDMLNASCEEYKEPGMERFNNEEFGWVNRTWKNKDIRRAHVDVVDVRDTKKLWMCHVCLFPNTTNGGPIYGFDVICGARKITGAFHDFSPLLKKEHPLTTWFVDDVKHYKPSKDRELPDWAKAIFSPGMIAAGNIQEDEEAQQVCDISLGTLNHYIRHIGEYNGDSDEKDVIKAQNYYCTHQQMNPHTPKVMERLGLPEEDIKLFCSDNLFPKIK